MYTHAKQQTAAGRRIAGITTTNTITTTYKNGQSVRKNAKKNAIGHKLAVVSV